MAPANQTTKKGQFMNFSQGHSGTKVFEMWIVLVFLRKNTRIHQKGREIHEFCVKLLFSYSPPPRIHPPSPPTPLRRESISSRFSMVFESILSRFWVATRKQLKIDPKTIEKLLEIDFLEGGSVVVGDESGGLGCSWKTISPVFWTFTKTLTAHMPP